MKKYELFASIYESTDKLQSNQMIGHALDFSYVSELFTVWAESPDDAKDQFYCSSQFNVFADKYHDVHVYTFLIDEQGNFLNV